MSDVNANIGIHFDTSDALAQLRRLQAGLSKFNQALTEGNVAAANAQKGLNSQLIQSINSTGKFVASQKTIATSTTAFTDALEKNKLSMSQYFRYTGAAATMNSKTLKNVFAQERDVLKRAMKDRVKTLQTQYVQLTNANGELVKVLQVVPKHLKMVNGQYADYATRTQMAAQRQQFLNQLLKQGSTQLLNFGKNTQWAGRQLMVGLTIPLSILGSTAAKVFREMEQATIRFTRVYGDLTTSMGDTDKAVAEIQLLAKEFTKFGIAAKDTMEMAASAAAMGLTGADLQAQVTNATRLAVLGQVEQAQALETTISLQNAFGISAEQLAGKINYLNAVENQTVLSIEDLTIAIPKAGPVVKQLGGSVEDLAFFMTAMKEGGINASEGANALKSGLASMINPAKKTSEFLAGLGINIKGIVDANAGNLKGTVVGFAQALDTLDPLNRARAIEQLFGKFQFARLSTLFQNVTKDTSQAARALGLAGASVEELAILSERELGKVENAVGVKFQKSLEDLKLQLIPIGKAFLEAVTPIVQFAGKILEKFNNLSDGTKKFVVGFIGLIGGIAPIVLMTVGLVANGVANLIKFFAMLRGGVAKLNGQNNVLGAGFDYLTQAETENLVQTQALHVSHTDLISTFNVEKTSVDLLAAAYQNAASQARALASGSPALFNAVPGPKGAVSGLPKFAKGKVPGNESEGDSILALVAPGETIVPTALSKKYAPLLKGIMGDDLPGFKTGRYVEQASQADKTYSASQAAGDPSVQQYIENELGRIRNLSKGALIKYAEATGKDVSDASATALEKIRDAVVSDFKKIVEEVKAEAGRVTEAGIESIGKKFDPSKGSSRMGAYAPKFDQLQRQEFSHVGQTRAVSSSYEQGDGLDLIPAARNQVELIKKFYGDGGGSGEMPDLKVANAHAFMLKGKLNNAMSTKGKSQSYEAKNGAGSLGVDFQADFEKTGAEKWRAMTTMMGGDFDELKAQAETYDNLLIEKLKRWNADNAAKEVPEIFDDATFEMLESQVTGEIQKLAPEFASIVELAKTKITGIRISLGEDFDEVNAMLKANNAGTLGTSSSNSKILNHEARPEDPKMLGTMKPQAIADAVDADLTAAETVAETKSPSKRTQRLGKDIADGLALGLAEGKDGVKAQSSQLTDAAIPTAAETQARTEKMDLGNKAFYDDLDTPEMRDERQILKSQDRQRRKLGATATVDSMSTTPVDSQASILIASKARTEAAAEKLAVSTEQAATAQTQVVQQIRDESKSRVTIKGNTVNIQKAREDADKAENEAAITRARAAAIEKEQAVQKARKSPTTITDEQVLAAKEKANAAELKAAETRTTLAMAEAEGKNIVISDEDVKDIGKVKKIQDKNQEVVSNGTQEQGDGLRRIVDGTEDAAESTLLVADQTDEIATVTGDIIPAQTENLDSVITTGALNDAIVGTTGDIHGSTIDTAMSQEDINKLQEEEKFLREQMNAKLGQQNSAINSDLSQTGKKRYTVDQALDEAYGDGTDANPGYTMDKNGKLLFDPELDADGKKQPTTMTQKQITKKKRGMRREKVGKYSGKATGALGAATMVAGMAGAPPQVTAALGAATTVAQFAPMIAGMGPIGWAVAGIAAVGASAYLVNKHFEGMAKAQAEYVRNTTASSEKLKAIGELNGVVGANEKMNKRRENGQLQGYNEVERKGTDYGVKYLENSTGKLMMDSLKTSINKTGAKEAAEEVALQLAAQVSDGVLSAEQAKSVAYQIGLNLKDSTMTMNINGNLRALIGPNGEDLVNDPLTARMRLVAVSENRTKAAKSNIKKSQKENFGWSWLGLKKSGAAEAAQVAALSRAAVEMALLQADSMAEYVEKQKETLEAQRAITTDKAKQLEIDEKLANLDSMAARANARVAVSVDNAVAQTDGIITGQSGITNSSPLAGLLSGKSALDSVTGGYGATGSGALMAMTAFSPIGSIMGALFDRQGRTEDAYFDANKDDVKAKYKGTAQEASAQRVLDLGAKADEDKSFAGDKVAGRKFEAKLQILMSSGVMDPDSIEDLLRIFGGNYQKLNTMLTVGVKMHGGSKMAELTGLLASTNDKTAKKIIVRMVRKSPKEFDSISKALALIKASDGLEVSMDLMLTNMTFLELEALSKKLEALDAMKEPITQQVVVQYGEDHNVDMDGVIDNWDYYGDMKPEVRKEAIQTYTTLKEFLMSFDSPEAKKQWAIDTAKAEADMVGEEGSKEYNEKYTKTYDLIMLDDTGEAATGLVKSKYGLDPNLAIAQAKSGLDDGDKKERDTTYDELNKRLRNVRNSAINAAGGFKELQRAIAATGSKAIGNKFKGLEQQLIRMGQTSQFTDYLAGLDTKELKKFAYTATAADVKKKKGKQKYKQVDPVTGKMVTKTQKFKAGDTVLTQAGRDMEQGYKKAIIGDYNKAQLQSVTYAKQEIVARTKLLALGFDEQDIRTMLADENYKTLVATGKITKQELETNAALTQQARIRNQISSAIVGQRDLENVTNNQKRIPEVVRMMQEAGVGAEGIREAISDPTMLDTLIVGMDSFATLAEDAQSEFNELLGFIDGIPERKLVEIVFTQTTEEKQINAANAAFEMFDVYKQIDENTLKNQEGNTFAGLQVMIEDLNNDATIAQNAINLTQSKIDDMQKEVDADQRAIETNFTRPIEQKQKEIEKLTRSAELNFTRPIQALQERSAVLSHDLDVMNKAAESINEKYNKQQEALTKVAEINQQIISQQQQQLGLADALSQGDISAAARAVQEMRSSNAANYATNAQDALQKARENELGGLRGGVSGKSQKEIEAEQWDISQKTYDLELKRAAVDKEILGIQDAIYTLEQNKQVALDAIQVKTDAIAKITFGILLDEQNALKAITDKILPLQQQSDLLAKQIITNDRNRIIGEKTREDWVLTKTTAEAIQKLAAGELAAALAANAADSNAIKGSWEKIREAYDAIKTKSVTITQHIVTTYGGGSNPGGADPNAGKTNSTKSPGAAWISDGKGGWKQPAKPAGDYGWDDTKGWVKGYYGSTPPPAAQSGYGRTDSAAEANMRANALEETKRLAAAAAKAEEERLAALEIQRLQNAAKAEGLAKRYGGFVAMSSGGLVPKYFAEGGFARGTDTVPAMLTPGEFVMSRYAVNSHGTDKMKAINSGASVGDSVYNYNLSVNVKSDANPDQIAKTVIAQIKQIDSQRVRGTRI